MGIGPDLGIADPIPVEVVRVPEGESGLARYRLTEARLRSIASFFAQPTWVRKGQTREAGYRDDEYAFLAARLGVTTRYVRRFERSPRLRREITERLRLAVTKLMPDVIWGQLMLAVQDRDTGAARYLGEYEGTLRGKSGTAVNVQQNVAVGLQVNSQIKDGISEDETVREELRLLRESGYLDRLLGEKPTDAGSGPK